MVVDKNFLFYDILFINLLNQSGQSENTLSCHPALSYLSAWIQ